MLSCLVMSGLFATLWTVTHQAPVSMGFSRKEYWSGLAFPPPGDLPPLGIEPMSPASPALQVVLYLLGERVTLVNKIPVPVPQLSQSVHTKMHRKTPESWIFPHLQNYSPPQFTYYSPDIISVTFKIARCYHH